MKATAGCWCTWLRRWRTAKSFGDCCCVRVGSWIMPGLWLLPLDRARWLRADIVNDAVYTCYFVDDSRGDSFEDFAGQARPVGRHRILRFHHAHGDGASVRPSVTHYPYTLNWKQNCEGLPDFVVEACAVNFVDYDCVGGAKRLKLLAGYFA